MKYIFSILMLFVAGLSQAQQLNSSIKKAIAADDSTALVTAIKTAGYQFDDCFDVEGVSYSLLAISIKMDRPSVFNHLVANKMGLNKICKDKSPLMFATKYGKLDMVKALIKAGADPKQLSDEKETALDYAVKYKQAEIENFLKSLNTK